MFPGWLQRWARRLAEGVVSPLARSGITPNTVTVLGFVFNVGTAGVLATGHLTTGGALLFLAGLFDMLDGALARVAERQSDFGGFLDSMLDRYSEAAILLALLYIFTTKHDTPAVILTYIVAIGSIMISYARARAGGLGIDCSVGIAPRPERVLVLGLGLLFTPATTVAALVVLALLTHITAMQRLVDVWRKTRKTHLHPEGPRNQAPQTTESVT